MARSLIVLLAMPLIAACSAKKTEPAPATAAPSADAGVKAAPVAGSPPAPPVDDDPRYLAPQPQPGRAARPIDVTLRSSPSGAQVAVDGTVIGTTPSFWGGVADGREHQFVFTLRGYAIAQYRFVPVSSGVIHARLGAIAEEADAGVPPPEVVPPGPPIAPTVVQPTQPTVVKPVESSAPTDAAPAVRPGNPVGPQP